MSEKAIVAASNRVFKGLSTAPIIGTAKCASIISGILGAMIATVSRRLTPSRVKADASLVQRSSSWAYVYRREPSITATLPAKALAARVRKFTGDNGT
jgi:hypothetical protein